VLPEPLEIAGVSGHIVSVLPVGSLEDQVGLHFDGGVYSVVSIPGESNSKGAWLWW